MDISTQSALDNNGSGADFRYQHLLESTRAIPWEMDPATWGFTYIGPQVEKVLGYPVSQWRQPDFWTRHLHPDDRDKAIRCCKAALARGENHEFEYRMLAADGRTVWIRDIVHVVKEQGRHDRLQGFLFDVTERKQAENVMRALAETGGTDDIKTFLRICTRELAAVYDARYAFVGLLREDGLSVQTLAVLAGDEFMDNFAYTLEGTPCKDILDKRKELIPTGASTLYSDDQMLVDMGIDSYFGAPLIDTRGRTIGLVSVMDVNPMQLTTWSEPILGIFATRIGVEMERDAALNQLQELNATLEQRVTERTRDLQSANQELESFSYSVSHDLRAPLRVIDGFSAALEEDCADKLDTSGRNYLQRIRSNVQYMSLLIDGLLQMFRITKHEIHATNVDLAELADKSVERLRENDPDRSVTFVNQHQGQVRGDRLLLSVVLDNLLGNAWKYTARVDAAVVEFGVMQQDGKTVHYVRDNGVGFDMAYANKLFGAFQRLHNQQDYPGTGIGLVTVQRILLRHGGSIWAEAELDRGATFYFTL